MQERRTQDQLDSNIEIWYNWDEDEEEWRAGTRGSERIELRCNAQFGRPAPEITWTVNRNDRNSLDSEKNLFKIRSKNGDVYDPSGYIKDWVSDLTFDVNNDFMNYLSNTHGINVNPGSGSFDFDLDCNVNQVRNHS